MRSRPWVAVLLDENTSTGGTRYEAAKGYFLGVSRAGGLPFGLPTFYVLFDAAPGLAFTDGDIEAEGAALAAASAVTLVMIGQDRIVRDPVEWAREIGRASCRERVFVGV